MPGSQLQSLWIIPTAAVRTQSLQVSRKPAEKSRRVEERGDSLGSLGSTGHNALHVCLEERVMGAAGNAGGDRPASSSSSCHAKLRACFTRPGEPCVRGRRSG